MFNRFLILAFLSPVWVFAQTDTRPDLASFTADQLCALRSSAAVRDELQRRDLFDRQELRSIEKEQVRRGIGVEALLCFMGEPDDFIPRLGRQRKDPVDGYIYSLGEARALVVHVRYREDESIVVGFIKTTLEAIEESTTCRGLGCSRTAALYGAPGFKWSAEQRFHYGMRW